VILGLGTGILPVPTASQNGLRMPLTPVVTQAGLQEAHSPLPSHLQLLLFALTAGIVVAVSVFLIVKRRT